MNWIKRLFNKPKKKYRGFLTKGGGFASNTLSIQIPHFMCYVEKLNKLYPATINVITEEIFDEKPTYTFENLAWFKDEDTFFIENFKLTKIRFSFDNKCFYNGWHYWSSGSYHRKNPYSLEIVAEGILPELITKNVNDDIFIEV